jgi:hypothetical protein
MRALARPLLRELVRSPLAGAAVAVTLPISYELVRGHEDVRTSATLAAVAGAALFGIAFDDPAQRTLNACAVGRTTRRWIRSALLVALLGAGWGAVVLVTRVLGADIGPVSERLPEVTASAALATAFAAVGLRTGSRSPGLNAALVTVLTVTMVTAASLWSDKLRWLPRLGDQSHASRWWVTSVIAAVAATWWARDPATRSLPRAIRRTAS